MLRRTLPCLPLLLALTSCGDGPEPYEPGAESRPAASAASSEVHFHGKAVLKGALAEATEGAVMVSVRPQGVNMPVWTYKIPMDGPEVRSEGGERAVHFDLSAANSMIPGDVPLDVPLEVQVMYSPNGYVESEGIVKTAGPAEPGEAVELVLDPDA